MATRFKKLMSEYSDQNVLDVEHFLAHKIFRLEDKIWHINNEKISQLESRICELEEALSLIANWSYTDIVYYCNKNGIKSNPPVGIELMRKIAKRILHLKKKKNDGENNIIKNDMQGISFVNTKKFYYLVKKIIKIISLKSIVKKPCCSCIQDEVYEVDSVKVNISLWARIVEAKKLKKN